MNRKLLFIDFDFISRLILEFLFHRQNKGAILYIIIASYFMYYLRLWKRFFCYWQHFVQEYSS